MKNAINTNLNDIADRPRQVAIVEIGGELQFSGDERLIAEISSKLYGFNRLLLETSSWETLIEKLPSMHKEMVNSLLNKKENDGENK